MREREVNPGHRIGFNIEIQEGGSRGKTRYDQAFQELVRDGQDEYAIINRYPDVFANPIESEFHLTARQQDRVSKAKISDLNLRNNRAAIALQGHYPISERGVKTLAELLSQKTWGEVLSMYHVGVRSTSRLRSELKKFIENEDYKKDPPTLTPTESRALEILNELADEDQEGLVRLKDLASRLGKKPAWAYVLYNSLKKKDYEVPSTHRR